VKSERFYWITDGDEQKKQHIVDQWQNLYETYPLTNEEKKKGTA
jgi:hypothetical protein